MVVVVSPTTLPEPPAFEAATIRREIADVDLGAEQRVRHRPADQRAAAIIVEERGQHEYDHEQREAALPVMREYSRELRGHTRFLEVPRQKGEAEQ